MLTSTSIISSSIRIYVSTRTVGLALTAKLGGLLLPGPLLQLQLQSGLLGKCGQGLPPAAAAKQNRR